MNLPTIFSFGSPYTTTTKSGTPIANGFPFASGQIGYVPYTLNRLLTMLINDAYGTQEFALQKFFANRTELWGYPQATQGVFMWNMSPTATPHELHTDIWEPITETIIRYLTEKPNLAWLVFVKDFEYTVPDNHLFLQLGPICDSITTERPFTEANNYLELMGENPITW